MSDENDATIEKIITKVSELVNGPNYYFLKSTDD